MKFALSDFKDAIELLLRDNSLKTVTIFCSPLSNVKQRIRASRVEKCPNEIKITFGKPNYAERKFLALCKKAKTKPRRIWLHYKSQKKTKVYAQSK